MNLTPRVPFRHPLRAIVIRAVYRRGLRQDKIEEALAKWEAGLSASDIRCDEEAKGKGYGIESLCQCDGCNDRKCFLFFDQMRNNFGVGG